LDELSELTADVTVGRQLARAPLEDCLRLGNGYLRYQWGEAGPWLAKALDDYPDAAAVYVTMSELQIKLRNDRKSSNFSRAAEQKQLTRTSRSVVAKKLQK